MKQMTVKEFWMKFTIFIAIVLIGVADVVAFWLQFLPSVKK